MAGRIENRQLVTVSPVDPEIVQPGDVVLCKVHGSEYLHLVKAVKDGRFQIGNNKGHINGWVGPNGIYGLVVKVEN
jgi:cell wall-associated NlpC family hydrolase